MAVLYIKKQQEELTEEDFFHGQIFEGEIFDGNDWIPVLGKITLVPYDKKKNTMFLCQNGVSGDYCAEKHGMEESYTISSSGRLALQDHAGINVRKLKLQHKISSITEIPKNEIWYANVVGLEDPADDRLMSNFADDLSFVGFSKINKGPIFKIKENGQTEGHWYKNVISKISEIGGLINMVSDLSEHIDEI